MSIVVPIVIPVGEDVLIRAGKAILVSQVVRWLSVVPIALPHTVAIAVIVAVGILLIAMIVMITAYDRTHNDRAKDPPSDGASCVVARLMHAILKLRTAASIHPDPTIIKAPAVPLSALRAWQLMDKSHLAVGVRTTVVVGAIVAVASEGAFLRGN